MCGFTANGALRVPVHLSSIGTLEPALVQSKKKVPATARWPTGGAYRQRDQGRINTRIIGMDARIGQRHQTVVDGVGIPAPPVIGLVRKDLDPPETGVAHRRHELRGGLLA